MLTISTKGRYATRIVVNLGGLRSGETKTVKQIAEEEDVTAHYCEQMLIKLKASGLVRSVRGIHGGYMLAKPVDMLTVSDVLENVEGQMAISPCIEEPCSRASICPSRSLWIQANEVLMQVFSKTTIQHLIQENEKQDVLNYAI